MNTTTDHTYDVTLIVTQRRHYTVRATSLAEAEATVGGHTTGAQMDRSWPVSTSYRTEVRGPVTPAPMTLRLVFNRPNTPVGDVLELPVADTADAHRNLAEWSHAPHAVTGYLTGADGSWHGTGVTGGGGVTRSDWA